MLVIVCNSIALVSAYIVLCLLHPDYYKNWFVSYVDY